MWRRVGLLLFSTGWGANHFAPLLLVYRERLGLDASGPALLFGIYALGLMPGLLIAGPLSDRLGRRAVVLPAAAIALAASVAAGAVGAFTASFPALVAARFVYGVGAGGAMSAGATWVVELSREAPPGTGSRRATIALSSGFGFGALISGLVAQFAPAPTVLPFVIHVAVLAAMLGVARRVPETVAPGAVPAGRLLRIELDRAGWRQFVRGVVPMAPFVFAYPAVANAALPSMLDGALGRAPIAYIGVLSVLTLATGVLAQPLTQRFAPATAARLGMAIGAVGFALGAITVAVQASALLLVVMPVVGAAYGVCMTAGLSQVQRLARPDARGGITGLYYVLTYLGFALPYLLALATRWATPTVTLGVTTALAALVVVVLPREPR